MTRIVLAVGLVSVLSSAAFIMAGTPRKAEGAVMTATYYGGALSGKKTASGEIFDSQALTAAHPTLPFGTMLLVCDDRCARVRVNDRTGATDAELDLSEGAARATGLIEKGKSGVSVVTSPTPSGEAPEIVELPRTGIGQ